MTMTTNEKKALYAFGCPNREATVERLRYAAGLATDPVAKKLFYTLAVKLSDDDRDRWYHCFFYNMRLELERASHHKYLPDRDPFSVAASLRSYRKRAEQMRICGKRYF